MLIRNKVLQLSAHFLLGYSNKLELWGVRVRGTASIMCPPPTLPLTRKHNLNNSIFGPMRESDFQRQITTATAAAAALIMDFTWQETIISEPKHGGTEFDCYLMEVIRRRGL